MFFKKFSNGFQKKRAEQVFKRAFKTVFEKNCQTLMEKQRKTSLNLDFHCFLLVFIVFVLLFFSYFQTVFHHYHPVRASGPLTWRKHSHRVACRLAARCLGRRPEQCAEGGGRARGRMQARISCANGGKQLKDSRKHSKQK